MPAAPSTPSPAPVVLLGPQRLQPTLGEAVRELGVSGRIAVVTAGWQEREAEVGELAEHLLREGGCEAVPLDLYRRAEEVFAADAALAAAHRQRQDDLQSLQGLYRLQLRHRVNAWRALLSRPGRSEVVDPERRLALEAIRRLDAHQRRRLAAIHADFTASEAPLQRPSVAAQRDQLAALLDGCVAVAIAGGHVVVLLNRLRLFGLDHLIAGLPLLAWSAGAMVLAESVVVFHDRPPQGPGNAELMEVGLGRVRGLQPLPHASRRLLLGDPRRVALLAHRFPRPVALDPGGHAVVDQGTFATEGFRLLTPSGEVRSFAAADHRAEDLSESTEFGGFVPVGEPSDAQPPARSAEGDVSSSDPAQPSAPEPDPGVGPRSLAIRRLTGSAKPPTSATLDAFLARHHFPLSEGTTTTFVFRGEATEVNLRHWIYGLPSTQPFQRLAGTDLWYLTLELPECSRVEYKIEVVQGEKARWIRDPLNGQIAHDPFGANSVFHGVGYETPVWTLPDDDTRQGSFEEVTVASEAFGDERVTRVYLPARYRPSRRYPLIVFHDGEDYARYASLVTVLDNLVERLEIEPPIVALSQPKGDRLEEYAADPRHARYLAEELLPRLEEDYPIQPGPEGRGLAGASFGAVAALSSAWHYPGTWGHLLLQSGSFAFSDVGRLHRRGEVFDPVVEFMNRFRDEPRHPADKLFISCGIYESLIYENRSLVPLLQEAGLEVRYREARDGHNWENWRDRLREGLSWLFPGPLRMVYE